jgi:hypothetical protein
VNGSQIAIPVASQAPTVGVVIYGGEGNDFLNATGVANGLRIFGNDGVVDILDGGLGTDTVTLNSAPADSLSNIEVVI